ncbi:MAG TPA: PIN domain-containing protein, partial [Chloroflexi bacterium]|nr:PIN domain-containing protein [Chloroflexota bacterium]
MKSLRRRKRMSERLLDTNVLILHLREKPGIAEILTRWGEESDLYISVVTRTEILAGMRPREEERTLALL